MKRIITLLLAILMICMLTIPASATAHIEYGSTLSEGNIVIVAVIALVAVLAVIYFAVKSRKNKK